MFSNDTISFKFQCYLLIVTDTMSNCQGTAPSGEYSNHKTYLVQLLHPVNNYFNNFFIKELTRSCLLQFPATLHYVEHLGQ